ncbi:MAG: acyl-CoA desaturase [Phycisphaerales bacterium]|nr:acyl-CoA desaturase [Phycisphaerales bacterium]
MDAGVIEQNSGPTRTQRIATFLAVVVPFLGLIAAIVFLWGRGLGWVELVLLAGMYLATGFGITVGYHRLFVHRSFETVGVVKLILAALGSMALEGSLFKWSAIHRKHHQHSDEPGDPHSPCHYGGGVWGVLAGLWHSHMGWMFTAGTPELSRYVRDLQADRLLRVANGLFPVWVLIGLLIPAGIAGWITGTWFGTLLGFIWGGLVRIFLVHHVTFSVNSICHVWGRRPFRCPDQSRNNFLVGVLALGEGWHNNHHAFPTSARHGLRWWEIDFSYLFIRVLQWVGLAWSVRVPEADTMAAKLRS